MTREQRIISALMHSREAYESLNYLVEEDDFSTQNWIVLQLMLEYYNNDEQAQEVDQAYLLDSIVTKYKKHKDILSLVITELEEVSIPNCIAEYTNLKREALRHKYANALILPDNEEEIEYYKQKLNEIDNKDLDNNSEAMVGMDIDEILGEFSKENLIPIHPPELNELIDNGLIPGTQVAIYAPTEVGKTLLAINFAAHFLRNGVRVLYVGNEDPAKRMLMRIYNNLTGLSKEEIISNPASAKELAEDNGYNNLIFYPMSPGSIAEIRRAIEVHQPDVVFVDQMANLESKLSKVEKNEFLASQLRNIAIKFGIVSIIVHQASENAYGKAVLEKQDMYFTNVGVQGQMDLMIGIGMTNEHEQQNRRVLTLTKNKLSGRHDTITVRVNPEISAIIE